MSHPITRALLSAMMHSTQPMVLTDPSQPDHPMLAVNPAFSALTGYEEAAATGRNCRFLQGAETDPETPRRIRQCLDQGRGCIEWLLNYRRDGTKFWNLLFISPVFAPDGTLLHFFGNQRDITQGPPSGLPDYVLGKSEMPLQAQREFDALLRDATGTAEDDAARAKALEHAIDTARRLNDLTLRLDPAPWEPPAA
jgi:PAS domain S-box-containing protein